METIFYDEQMQKEAAIAAQAMAKAVQIKPLDKCINDAGEIAAMAAKAADYAESIVERLGGPNCEGENGCASEDREPIGSLSRLNAVQESSLTRLRRLFRALERMDGLG